MAFLWRRRSFWFKFIILVAIFWITIVLIHLSGKKELELTKTDFNDRFNEFLVDSRRDLNHHEVVNPDNDSKNNQEDDFTQKHSKQLESIRVDLSSHKNNGKLAKLIEDPGHMGRAVTLPTNLSAEVKKLVDEGWTKNAFNEYVSNIISVRRELPDPRYLHEIR